jgi:hypothetical protein
VILESALMACNGFKQGDGLFGLFYKSSVAQERDKCWLHRINGSIDAHPVGHGRSAGSAVE